MLLDKPYFMKNKDWYIENEGIPIFLGGDIKRKYILTDKATKKAIDSYDEYYNIIENNVS